MIDFDVSPETARTILAEIQSLSSREAAEYLPVDQNTFARLVLFRLIRRLDEQLPEGERGQVTVPPPLQRGYKWGR